MARVAMVGAGVSGLTCGVILAEHGYDSVILAEDAGQTTTSAVAAAIWFPYDAEPAARVIAWSVESYQIFAELSARPESGVRLIDLRTFKRTGEIQIPDWAKPLGAFPLQHGSAGFPPGFSSGFSLQVPLIDTTIYLDYLAQRFAVAGGSIRPGISLKRLEEADKNFDIIVNCSGIGARQLVPDQDLEPHRGQVVVVPKLELDCAIVSDDLPLMYVIPRTNDCVFGGTNELGEQLEPDSADTARIVSECSRVLQMASPPVLAERVGLRPFRRSGIRLSAGKLADGRPVIHNYGHGGCGFTLSWGCAAEVARLAAGAR